MNNVVGLITQRLSSVQASWEGICEVKMNIVTQNLGNLSLQGDGTLSIWDTVCNLGQKN